MSYSIPDTWIVTYEHLTEKYTNKELYEWLKKEAGGIFKALFQLAIKVARKAEKCYHFKIGDADEDSTNAKTFIHGSGNYWDGLHGGLLAGGKTVGGPARHGSGLS